MKKITAVFTLVAVLMFGLSVPVQAQVQFGVKGGLNVGSMSLNNDLLKASNRTGYYFGPTVKFTLPVVGIGIDAAALYDQRETKLSNDKLKETSSFEKTVKQQQIVVPINLRYNIGLSKMAALLFYAGPQFGFNVGDKNQSIDGKRIDWHFKNSNLSINAGAGVMLLNHLQVSVNYNIACGKTGEATVDNTIDAIKARNHAWQVGAAYYF
ncbi:MAG: porin family protein [Prevotella pleuritidis]|jgi:hypothetical protein|uniref:Outer membrane protein beta-barrel domain protein n=1 Tax=Hoylesella pleuritidis F0068 TaxID=1081904 RepID=U2MQ18_9BACT|nr:porin family protein [Hoylesella pleuritidis]ERK01374.1 outer membrane protein beta-barrel domain protein [Hoylesella pleuritidis F0068]MBF1554168.1 porin family protein [Hoylesella pleuritidis]